MLIRMISRINKSVCVPGSLPPSIWVRVLAQGFSLSLSAHMAQCAIRSPSFGFHVWRDLDLFWKDLDLRNLGEGCIQHVVEC